MKIKTVYQVGDCIFQDHESAEDHVLIESFISILGCTHDRANAERYARLMITRFGRESIQTLLGLIPAELG